MPEPLIVSLSVGLGAFAGANLRYAVGLVWQRLMTTPFPGATLLINVFGSFLLALIVGVVGQRLQTTHPLRLLLTVGFCGGFTTFSTFALETVELLREGHGGLAAAYILASVLLSLGAAVLGFWLAGQLVSPAA